MESVDVPLYKFIEFLILVKCDDVFWAPTRTNCLVCSEETFRSRTKTDVLDVIDFTVLLEGATGSKQTLLWSWIRSELFVQCALGVMKPFCTTWFRDKVLLTWDRTDSRPYLE